MGQILDVLNQVRNAIKSRRSPLNYQRFAAEQTRLFREGKDNLNARREEWSAFAERAKLILTEVKENFKKEGFFENLYVDDSREHRTEMTYNQNAIYFFMGNHPTGIAKQLHDPATDKTSRTFVTEKGSSLVFSQGPRGEILVLVYPLQSEVLKPNEQYFIFNAFSQPSLVTDQDIHEAIKFFFWYSFSTSIFGETKRTDFLKRLPRKIWWFFYSKDFEEMLPYLSGILKLAKSLTKH